MLLQGCEAPAVDTSQSATSQLSGQQSTQAGEASVASADIWRPVPRSIRVYPSTRFIEESGRAILEARFELFDEMGDSVKAAGMFRIELYSVDESFGNAPKRLLYTWNTQTLTLDQQREHYDPIMRGYLFRLGVDNLRIAKQPTLLKATFTPVDQPRLPEVETIIRADW